jgi:nickel transport protein
MSIITRAKMHPRKSLIFTFLLTAVLILCSNYALAHRVIVFAIVEGDTVKTISKFPGGKRVMKGNIVVTDLQGNMLLKGVTDENGEFSFKIPKREPLKVVLNAGMGHGAEWTIPADEIPGATNERHIVSSESGPASAGEKENHDADGLKEVTSDEIQIAVEKALDRRLKPILSMLEKIHEPKTTFKDILGGIGYIVGLVGIVAYIQSVRKKTKNQDS